MARLNKSGVISEYQIQKAVKEWLDLHKVFFFSIPNEIARDAIRGRHFKATGMRKGASDLFIGVPRHNFHGMFLELKNERGTLHVEQRQFFRDAEKAGYFTAACWSEDEAIATLSWYLEIKKS